ncbi:fumarylacetoacetate hydrolase family protein [Pseudomonas sp. MAFF 301449]|uniref:Fumarylacetoacetate hydrolase family protein n=1 Tax=Pseudomonas cyclaminis TaxID=2781239 RepID=A0ABR9STB5_9PSED|nr:fumarylacetoacetate hydrolase family protein [Pseudomonas cyclaminis]MBE8591559.1 fumarylacetoacetate hydrolase family protein [Pseudomonas cyclaminis]MBE8598648.1 fumarylacetoacetate hydrolase family protein [Pseudomonas cyclaminis]
MAVYVLRFVHQNRAQWGVIRNEKIAEIPGEFASTGELVSNVNLADLAALPDGQLSLADVTLLPPITSGQQFVCQGANYRQHMIESGMDPDSKNFNMIFTKATSCIVAADSELIKPLAVRFLDYEVELGLVLKRGITGTVAVTDSNLHEYVAGVVIVNDYSARDIQIPQMQFYKGKSFRTFGPVGPYLCLLEKEEMTYLKDLKLSLSVNGQVRQNDSSANLVFGPAQTLSELSSVQNLNPGDLIATGTPAGCALAVPSPAKQRIAALLPEAVKWKLFLKAQEGRDQYLKVGDVVEASIRSSDGKINLGTQRNVVVEEKWLASPAE